MVYSAIEFAQRVAGLALCVRAMPVFSSLRAEREPFAGDANRDELRGIARRCTRVQVDIQSRGAVTHEKRFEGTYREPHTRLIE
jgi:hypothetical protein